MHLHTEFSVQACSAAFLVSLNLSAPLSLSLLLTLFFHLFHTFDHTFTPKYHSLTPCLDLLHLWYINLQ